MSRLQKMNAVSVSGIVSKDKNVVKAVIFGSEEIEPPFVKMASVSQYHLLLTLFYAEFQSQYKTHTLTVVGISTSTKKFTAAEQCLKKLL